MTPGLYLGGSHPGWPWSPDAISGLYSDQFFYKKVPGPHHVVPVEIAKLLSVKEWHVVVAFSSPEIEAEFYFEETVTAGTYFFRQNVNPELDDPLIGNLPGWLKIQDAIEQRIHPDTEPGVDYYSGSMAGFRIVWNGAGETLEASIPLPFPVLGFDTDNDDEPVWAIPVTNGWGSLIRLYNADLDGRSFARPTGILYDGEQLGEADPNGWTVSITPGDKYDT